MSTSILKRINLNDVLMRVEYEYQAAERAQAFGDYGPRVPFEHESVRVTAVFLGATNVKSHMTAPELRDLEEEILHEIRRAKERPEVEAN